MGMGGFKEDPLQRKYSLVIGETFPCWQQLQGYCGSSVGSNDVGMSRGLLLVRVIGEEVKGQRWGWQKNRTIANKKKTLKTSKKTIHKVRAMNHHQQVSKHSTRQEGGSSIHDVDLVLFDLDGLLVDSEVFHWQAYQRMVRHFGYELSWDYSTYLAIAGSASYAIADQLRKEFPVLFEHYSWEEMYAVKKDMLGVLMDTAIVPLMPGVEQILTFLANQHKRMVVVTHSSLAFVEKVKASHEIFSLINLWIYREMYVHPKPAPDCYKMACDLSKVSPHKTIGFEDSWRGIEALRAAGCRPVLVNARDEELRKKCERLSISSMASFDEIGIQHFHQKKPLWWS